jgi:holo-[acyl-carrier protein] synthase
MLTASGIGIDLLEIERLERALRRHPRLAERVFTSAEREYAAARARHWASAVASAFARSRSSPGSRRP